MRAIGQFSTKPYKSSAIDGGGKERKKKEGEGKGNQNGRRFRLWKPGKKRIEEAGIHLGKRSGLTHLCLGGDGGGPRD